MAQNFTRSSSGTEGSSARASTRSLKSSHDSSRFRIRVSTSCVGDTTALDMTRDYLRLRSSRPAPAGAHPPVVPATRGRIVKAFPHTLNSPGNTRASSSLGGNTLIFADVGQHGPGAMPSWVVWSTVLAAPPGAGGTAFSGTPGSRWAGCSIWAPAASSSDTPGYPATTQDRVLVLVSTSGT